MTVDDLLILTEDQIDFAALDLALLRELALQERDPFIATSALGNLCSRDVSDGPKGCEEILNRDGGDRHLRAFAMTLLFSSDRRTGIVYMARLVDIAEEKLLGAMVENVMSEAQQFQVNDRGFVELLVAHVRAAERARFSDPDEVAAFLDLFDPAHSRPI